MAKSRTADEQVHLVFLLTMMGVCLVVLATIVLVWV